MTFHPLQPIGSMTVVAALLLAFSGPARACEADDEGSPPPIATQAFGGLAALRSTPVRLAAVAITWTSYTSKPFPRSRVRIEYRFENPGSARTEQVGIRTSWSSSFELFEAPHARPTLDGRVPPLVTIDGAPFACSLERPEWRPWGGGAGSWAGAEGWCTGALAFPHGESRRVVEYEAPAWSRATAWDTLRQDFEAESTWRGPVDTLDAALPLAPLPGSPVVVSPAGVREDQGVARWHIDRPELAQVPPIYVGLDRLAGVPGTGRLANRGFALTASSTLAPQAGRRYSPDRAVDGDGATAWCESARGPGPGEWLELRTQLSPDLAARCRVQSFRVIPGLARSRATWRANNRLLRFRISSCARPEEGNEIDLTWRLKRRDRPALDWNTGAKGSAEVELEPQDFAPGHGHLDETACFRVTIIGVDPGRVNDTCIAEFLPVLSCSAHPER